MTEVEVSLYIAVYFIKNGLTEKDVHVSIDGAHVKTGTTVHFDIYDFYQKIGFKKLGEKNDRWQGEYELDGYDAHVIVSSTA